MISEGGWHPQYARVLLIQEIGAEAIVLVDGNGDGSEVESEQWFLTDGGWVAGSSGGVGSFDRRALWIWGTSAGAGYVIGCAEPGQSVAVEWMDAEQRATANDLGIWLCLFPDQPPSTRALGVPSNGFRPLTPQGSDRASLDRPLDRPRVIEPA